MENNNLPNIDNNNQIILNNIQELQNIERELFNNLETNNNLTNDERQKLILKINTISQMRVNLYKTLTNMNSYFQTALSNSQGTLQQQTAAIQIIERELNREKIRLKLLEEQKNNKVRLVQINNYYSERYSEHTEIMKIIIAMLVPIIILTILNKKNIIPKSVFLVLVIIISVIGSYFLWTKLFSIFMRDSMNYNEYNWTFNPETAPRGEGQNRLDDPWFTGSILGLCIGENCCSEGQTFDSISARCITNTSSRPTNSRSRNVEGFINYALIKDAYSNKYKI